MSSGKHLVDTASKTIVSVALQFYAFIYIYGFDVGLRSLYSWRKIDISCTMV